MNELDGDDIRISSHSVPAERDIEFIFVLLFLFSAMNELDGDDICISSRGVPAERDIEFIFVLMFLFQQ